MKMKKRFSQALRKRKRLPLVLIEIRLVLKEKLQHALYQICCQLSPLEQALLLNELRELTRIYLDA